MFLIVSKSRNLDKPQILIIEMDEITTLKFIFCMKTL